MESCFSSVVDILADDPVLVRSAKKFGNKLKIPESRLDQLMKTFVMGVTSPYELIHGILSEWIHCNGNSATVAELQRILKDNGWKFCLAETDGIPSTPKYATAFEPFGFGNVVKHFTGREAELKKLAEYFQSPDSPIVLLSGLGGIGKTQLATKFALNINTHINSYGPGTSEKPNSKIVKSLLPGENAQTLHQSIAKFGKRLGFPNENKGNQPSRIEKLLKKIMKKLTATIGFYKWLIIIDNVDEMYEEIVSAIKILRSFCNNVFVIVTSRRLDISAGEIKHLQILPLEKSSSIQFVKKSLEISDDYSRDKFIVELCEQLGHLPLALEHAVAYIKQRQTISLKGGKYNASDYLLELKKEETVVLDKECMTSEYPCSTMKVWNKTFDTIKTSYGVRGNVTLKVLDVISFLNPDYISTNQLCGVFVRFYNTEGEDIEKCLELLLKYSLINTYGEFPAAVSIHRLVQLAIRNRMKLEYPSKEMELLAKFWTTFNPKSVFFALANRITASTYDCIQIWNHSARFNNLDRIRASAVHQLFDEIGSSPRVDYYQFAVEGCKLLLRLFGEESLEYLTMQRRLLACRPEINDSFLENLLSLNEKLALLVGETHIEILSAGNCISEVLFQMGRHDESIKRCQRLRHCFSRIVGQEDKIIIQIKNEVADRLSRMGKTKEAAEMFQETLTWKNLNLGQIRFDDWDVLHLKGNIILYILHGGSTGAREKLQELNMLTENCRDHEEALWIKYHLAEAMEGFNAFEDALILMHEISEEWGKLKGPQNEYAVRAQEITTKLRQKLED